MLAALALGSILWVQRGSASLVPSEALPLGGYTARKGASFVEGGDDLRVRVVLFSSGTVRVAVAVAEMLTIPESLTREVRARIPKDIHLFLAATHTHCAPDSQMLNDRMTFAIPGIAGYKRKWLTWTADKIASAVLNALQGPPTEEHSLTMQVRLMDLNRGRRPGADPDRRAACFNDSEGKPLFLQFAAHPTLYDEKELHLRGDWIGTWMRAHDALALQGAIGDVSPKPIGASPAESCDAFVREFDKVFGPYPGEQVASFPLDFVSSDIALDPPTPHPNFAKNNGIPDALALSLVQKFAPPEASVSAFRIGKLAVIGIPGEPTAELGRKIERLGRREGFTWTLVVSHVNGWIGYILMPADYDRGGYEAELSFNGRLTAERVIQASELAIRRLAHPRRLVPAD